MRKGAYPRIGHKLWALVLLSSVGLAGCAATDNAAVQLPPSTPRVITEKPGDRDHARLVTAFGGEIRAPESQKLLNSIVARLVAASDRPNESFQVTILNSPVVNAFALPNGRLYVTRGLLTLANDSSEIAAVLSHEIAHITLRHASQRSEMQARSTLITRVTENVLKNAADAAAVKDRSRATLAGFSRSQELEADQVGVRVLARAGFDPFGAPRFLTALGKVSGGSDAAKSGPVDMSSTHPSTAERISLATQAARRASAPGIGEADRAGFMSVLDRLPYGEDPSDGVVRGNRFIHVRLGVAFDAPQGFSLENTSQAVLGSSSDGSRRLLFDAAETTEGQSLEDMLRSTWNDTIEPNSMESTTVNGLPVATALSKGKEWIFRLSAIRIGSTTYRMILAQKVGSGDLESTFQQTLQSVRQVSPEEARSIQPLHIQVVIAQPGETAELMANRMVGVERPLERFLLLNSLDKPGPLTPGESYKIIVE